MTQSLSQPASVASGPEPVGLTVNGQDLLFPQLPYDMHDRARSATGDQQLQRFVNNATLLKDTGRKAIFAQSFGMPRYDQLKNLAGRIKQHTLDHLDHYLEQFIDKASAAGVQVHFARDDKQANAICVDIAQRNDCRLCVKSKSMVTEETHLLPQLEAAGVRTIETDLGEFILQLDGDAPSHIVQPMIHKDRAAVARAFERKLGAAYTENAEQLTRIARDYLRDKYQQADLGISGGNFLIAETGSLVLCTNEGNGRLCTSLPRVHVAFVGIEKLIPRMADLPVFLKLLARSATAQPLTVYNHVITGPRRGDEPDGPEQVHIILVDNGRTDVLKPETREMLRCIRCGACLNACPVYRKVGGHSYGSVYSGPIGAILTPALKGVTNYPDLPNASSLCGACYEACPVKIDIPRHLVRWRTELIHKGHDARVHRLFFRMWVTSLRSPLAYRMGGWMQARLFRMMARQAGTLEPGDPYAARGWVSRLPGLVGGWTAQRDMPTPPARSFRHWWQHRDKDAEARP